jgi:hypothetical protein
MSANTLQLLNRWATTVAICRRAEVLFGVGRPPTNGMQKEYTIPSICGICCSAMFIKK